MRTNIGGFIGHFLLPYRPPPFLPPLLLSSPLYRIPELVRAGLGNGSSRAAASIPAAARRRQSDLERAKRKRLEKVCSSPMGGHPFCGLPSEVGLAWGGKKCSSGPQPQFAPQIKLNARSALFISCCPFWVNKRVSFTPSPLFIARAERERWKTLSRAPCAQSGIEEKACVRGGNGGGREAVYTVVKHRTGTAAAGTIYLDLYASHTCASRRWAAAAAVAARRTGCGAPAAATAVASAGVARAAAIKKRVKRKSFVPALQVNNDVRGTSTESIFGVFFILGPFLIFLP